MSVKKYVFIPSFPYVPEKYIENFGEWVVRKEIIIYDGDPSFLRSENFYTTSEALQLFISESNTKKFY